MLAENNIKKFILLCWNNTKKNMYYSVYEDSRRLV